MIIHKIAHESPNNSRNKQAKVTITCTTHYLVTTFNERHPIVAKKISGSVGKGGKNKPADVHVVQELLNVNISKLAPLALLVIDEQVGSKTIGAIEEFQRRVVGMNRPDGRVDPAGKTLSTLIANVKKTPPPPNLTAQFEATSRAGQPRQMMSGRITVNNQTYDFCSGGHGRGYLPAGTYVVTTHRWDRSERGFSVGGVGYSFAVSDKYDTRVGDTRTLLRIHPDGGSAGTNGCIGIVGNASVQRTFREGMRAGLNRSSNRVSLRVVNSP